MQFSKLNYSWHTGALFSSALSFACIHFSPALSSIFLALTFLCGLAILFFEKQSNYRIPFFLICLSALYIFQTLIGLTNADEGGGPGDKLLLKLPLLIAPLLFFVQWKRSTILLWLLLVCLPLCWIAVASVINYFLHFNFYNLMVLESKPIPIFTQVYHIEFSLILGIFTLISLLFLLQQGRAKMGDMHWLLLVISATNAIALHILSARTGIVGFWAGVIVALWVSKGIGHIAPWKAMLALVAIVGMAFFVPTIRNRVANSVDDLKSIAQGKDLNTKSFGRRWLAWDAAYAAIKERPLSGYGLQNVMPAMEQSYTQRGSALNEFNRIGPHNQYLETTLQSGLIALIILFTFLLGGIVANFRRGALAGAAFLIAYAIAALFESLLERQASLMLLAVLAPFLWNWTPENSER